VSLGIEIEWCDWSVKRECVGVAPDMGDLNVSCGKWNPEKRMRREPADSVYPSPVKSPSNYGQIETDCQTYHIPPPADEVRILPTAAPDNFVL